MKQTSTHFLCPRDGSKLLRINLAHPFHDDEGSEKTYGCRYCTYTRTVTVNVETSEILSWVDSDGENWNADDSQGK